MKNVVCESGAVLGPYESVEVGENGLLADGGVLFYTVIGTQYQITEAAPVQPVPDPATTVAYIEACIQHHLDNTAFAWGYGDGTPERAGDRLVGFRGDPNPVWDNEAQTFFTWRSAVWSKAQDIQNAWQPGDAVPTWESVLALLPVVVRPQ